MYILNILFVVVVMFFLILFVIGGIRKMLIIGFFKRLMVCVSLKLVIDFLWIFFGVVFVKYIRVKVIELVLSFVMKCLMKIMLSDCERIERLYKIFFVMLIINVSIMVNFKFCKLDM